ncbi:MAG: regulatory protein RecX [Candidatus Omnitrophica bacterium]|nr:regulatory protein RecX [Candidatus Omnitrophota bacterium]
MLVSCRPWALRFLKIRPRSVAELKEKLEKKGFEAKDIDQTIGWLQSTKLLDDRAFTKSWIQYRLARPFGFRRIVLELKDQGIDPAIIEEEIDAVKVQDDQHQTALELAKRRWQRLTGIEPQKKKKRIFDFLSRRGFGPDVIFKVLKQL